MDHDGVQQIFSRVSRDVSQLMGGWQAFSLATLIIIVWLGTGFFVGFMDQRYQMFINTFTTIVTFLMGFLILSSQNRDTLAIHLKLDELVRAMDGARNEIVAVEDLSERDLAKLKQPKPAIS